MDLRQQAEMVAMQSGLPCAKAKRESENKADEEREIAIATKCLVSIGKRLTRARGALKLKEPRDWSMLTCTALEALGYKINRIGDDRLVIEWTD